MINRHGIVPTETLAAALRDAPDLTEAMEKLTPGQRVRVAFATALKQIAHAARADPMLGLQLFETIEAELERTVDRMFMPHLHRVHRDARDEAERRIREEMEDHP